MRGICALALLASACAGRSPYTCDTSSQCVQGGVAGVCEPQGFCSFPDPDCPGGRKFEPGAGDNLGGTCVSVDAGVDTTCIAEVAAGRRHLCVRKTSGAVVCMGSNIAGQLGRGTLGNQFADAMPVLDSTGAAITDAMQISAGRVYTCALRAGGTVWCWGDDGQGQLGDNAPTTQKSMAVQVQDANGPVANMIAVAAGDRAACALDASHGVWCWGENVDGELGDGTTMPHPIAAQATETDGTPLGDATQLAVGGFHACILTSTGSVRCWGRDKEDEIGNGSATPNVPNAVTTIASGAAQLALGRYHSCALMTDGSVQCWGSGQFDRLANSTETGFQPPPEPTATAIKGLAGVTSIATGAVSCAVTSDHAALCWGEDQYGQTGTSGTALAPEPVHLSDGSELTGVDKIFAHFTSTCAKLAGGQVLCWGRNTEGQLGDPSFHNRDVAAPIGVPCP